MAARSTASLFPFSHLPPLVQTKILRQYIPFSDKVTVLCAMDEFAGLLDPDSPCWLLGYESFFRLLPKLSRLTPGLYVRSDLVLPGYGIHVSMDRECELSFTLCMLMAPYCSKRRRPSSYFDGNGAGYSAAGTVSRCLKSVEDVQRILDAFVDDYSLATQKPMQLYVKDDHVFFVNLAERKILWDDRTVHDISQNGICQIRIYTRKRTWSSIKMSVARLYVKPGGLIFIHDYREHVLRPTSFESFVMDRKHRCRTVCRIVFRMASDITMRKKVYNKNADGYYAFYTRKYFE